MAAIQNEISRILQAAPSRYSNPPNAAIILTASAPVFKIPAGGAADPAPITFTASLIELAGPVSFVPTGCTVTVSGNVATLTYANMPGVTASVKAILTENGQSYESNLCSVTKLADGTSGAGTPGADGARGAGGYYTTGSAWSDALADAATPGGNVPGDEVQISNGTTFIQTRQWNGSSWVVTTPIYDGGGIFPGSVTANKINSNGLEIRTPGGLLQLGVGGLQPGFEAPGTKNSEIISGGENLANNSSFERMTAGLANGYSIFNNAGGAEPTTASQNVGRAGGLAQVISWTGSHANTKGIFGSVSRNGWLPLKKYIFSIYAKTTSLQSAANLALHWTVAPASVVSLANPSIATDWQRYSFLITWGASVEPGGGAYISIGLGGGDGNIWFDDLMVTEGDVVSQYSASAHEAMEHAATAQSAANSALSDKLNKNADDILGGVLAVNTVSVPVGLRIGSLAWNAAGVRTSGFGLGLTPQGVIAYSAAGTLTFFISATNGDAYFAGQLASAYGSFGTVTIASGGSLAIGQTAYHTGTGLWFGFAGGVPKFSMGIPGVSSVRYDGTKIIIENAELLKPAFTISISSPFGTYFSGSKSSSGVYAGDHTATPSGRAGTFSYAWTIQAGAAFVSGFSGGYNSALLIASMVSNGNVGEFDIYCRCVCTHIESGDTCTASVTITGNFT